MQGVASEPEAASQILHCQRTVPCCCSALISCPCCGLCLVNLRWGAKVHSAVREGRTSLGSCALADCWVLGRTHPPARSPSPTGRRWVLRGHLRRWLPRQGFRTVVAGSGDRWYRSCAPYSDATSSPPSLLLLSLLFLRCLPPSKSALHRALGCSISSWRRRQSTLISYPVRWCPLQDQESLFVTRRSTASVFQPAVPIVRILPSPNIS
eukprot:3645458-Rhodomonas_salina.1